MQHLCKVPRFVQITSSRNVDGSFELFGLTETGEVWRFCYGFQPEHWEPLTDRAGWVQRAWDPTSQDYTQTLVPIERTDDGYLPPPLPKGPGAQRCA